MRRNRLPRIYRAPFFISISIGKLHFIANSSRRGGNWNASLERFLDFYNDHRPHQGYRTRVHTPSALFWETAEQSYLPEV